MNQIYAIDIGGSSIKHSMVKIEQDFALIDTRFDNIYLPDNDFVTLKIAVVNAIKNYVSQNKSLKYIAISTAGAVDKNGTVLGCGHFNGYENIDWAEILNEAYPGKLGGIVVVNDGKASAWAEFQKYGKSTVSFAHYVVGTGVGGALIFANEILYGDDDTAGALGHMKVASNGSVKCSCGNYGCLETLASGPAIVRNFSQLNNNNNSMQKLAQFDEVFSAAKNGNPLAIEAFYLAGEWLGFAVSNIVNIFNPKNITIGGGVIEASCQLGGNGGPYFEGIMSKARSLAFDDIMELTNVRVAGSGNDGGMLGVALICKEKFYQAS